MRFTVLAHELHSAVSHASSVTPTKSASLVAYTGVNLSVSKNELTVSGSDGEVSVSIFVTVEDTADGVALLAPRQLVKWLHKAPRGAKLSVATKGSGKLEVTLEDSNSPYVFHTMVASFPSVGAGAKANHPINLENLGTALTCVKDVADEVVGSTQTAVKLTFDGSGLNIDATDRLRITRAQLRDTGGPELTAVVELKALEMAKSLRSDKVGSDKAVRNLVFEGPGHRVTVRVLDAEFPPVENILSATPEYQVKVDRLTLADAIDRLACVVDDNDPLIMEFDGNTLNLSAESVNVGTGCEEVELTARAPAPTTLAVNISFMRQAVTTNPNPELTIGWSSPISPVFVSSEGKIDLVSVVMPIRLSE